MCLAAGELDVDRTLASISSEQFAEWMAYDRISPIGEERADLRAGIIAATIANQWRSKGPPAKPIDFMPFQKKRGPKSREEIHLAMHKVVAHFEKSQGQGASGEGPVRIMNPQAFSGGLRPS